MTFKKFPIILQKIAIIVLWTFHNLLLSDHFEKYNIPISVVVYLG